ncbi:MAG: hypothetical protein AAF573_13295 [Bacteroidota bacterium]
MINLKPKFKIFFIFLGYFCGSSLSLASQNIESRKDVNVSLTNINPHTILLDIGGTGGYGSLNYEYSFFEKKSMVFSARVGFSFFRFRDFERKWNPDLLFPFNVQLRKKWKNHSILFGVGQTISSIVKASADFSGKIRQNRWNGNVLLGYRFQKTSKPFFFQITYTPLLERYERFWHWGGIGVGYNFIKRR